MSFVAVWLLFNDPCLPHEDNRNAMNSGVAGAAQGLGSHHGMCPTQNTKPVSPALLALQSLRAWTLDADIQGKPWIITAWHLKLKLILILN